ncbi:MAG: rubredoxin [Desulfomonilaceae bacterium]|jgi:rubredoxin
MESIRRNSSEVVVEGGMKIYQCQTTNCGYMYNPEKGDRKGKIPKGVAFEDLPDDWKCPICGAGKKMFKPMGG